MKERMKKLTLMAFYQEKEELTFRLQELGVVHLESFAKEASTDLVKLRQEREDWKRALSVLAEHQDLYQFSSDGTGKSAVEAKEEALALEKKTAQLDQELAALKKEELLLAPWGNFDWQKLKKLREHDIYFRFYNAGRKDFKIFDFESVSDGYCEVLSREKGIVRFVCISKGKKVQLPFEENILPEKTITEIDVAKQRLLNDRDTIRRELCNLSRKGPEVRKALAVLEDKIAEQEALESYQDKARGKIVALHGWFPVKKQPVVVAFLKENNLSYEIRNPKANDKVPVILKNKRYPRIFESITKIFQLPNYNEFDLTPFIAVFYPIFFAYCLGDAGYGLVLFIISAIAMFTFLKKIKGVAILGMVLGTITAIMGIVKSGTLFGIPLAQNTDIPVFSFLAQYIIVTDDQNYVFNAFNVALMIGIVQIILAVVISIFKKIKYDGFTVALSTIGKLLIIVSIIVIFLGSMQGVQAFVPFVGVAQLLLIAGVVMVLLFHNISLPVGKRLGSGLLPLYFIFTGLLGDVLSYIRLFALGVASSILGLVVNQIGMQIMDDAGVVMTLVAVLFLLFGHAVNFALACLGAFVHPLRLTFVEFYNNAEFKGGGVPYRPFKKHISS